MDRPDLPSIAIKPISPFHRAAQAIKREFAATPIQFTLSIIGFLSLLFGAYKSIRSPNAVVGISSLSSEPPQSSGGASQRSAFLPSRVEDILLLLALAFAQNVLAKMQLITMYIVKKGSSSTSLISNVAVCVIYCVISLLSLKLIFFFGGDMTDGTNQPSAYNVSLVLSSVIVVTSYCMTIVYDYGKIVNYDEGAVKPAGDTEVGLTMFYVSLYIVILFAVFI